MLLEAFDRIKAESSSLAEIKKKFQKFASDNKGALGDLYRYRRVDKRGPYAARRNMDNPGKPGHKYDVIHPVTKKAMPDAILGLALHRSHDEATHQG